MAQPGDDRRGASRRSGEATRLGATGELASGPSTGSGSGAAGRTDRQGVSLSFAVHEAALQPEDDAELYYDLMLTDSSGEPSRSLGDAADWSQTADSNSESKVSTKTIIRTSNDAQNQNSRLRHSMPVQQQRSLNSIYASSRGHRPSCVLEQEFEVSISEDDSHQFNEIEDLQEIEASDDFVCGVDEEVDEIDEKLFGPSVPLQGHRLRHYHVTETTGTPEAVAYAIAAAAEPRVTTKLVPTAKPVPISKFATAASVFKTERTLPKTRATVLTASPVLPYPIVPALKEPPIVPYPIVPVLRSPPAAPCPMAPVTPLSTYTIEEPMPKDRPALTRTSVPITPLVTGKTEKKVRTAGSIYGPAGFSIGLSSRKVQYNRQPEVHEYTKESSGSGGGTRLEWKRQQDGVVLLDVGPPLTKEQEEAERRRIRQEMEARLKQNDAKPDISTNNEAESKKPTGPSSESVLRVPDQARSSTSLIGKSRPPVVFEAQIVGSKTSVTSVRSPSRTAPTIRQVLEGCSCYNGEPEPDSCRECLDELVTHDGVSSTHPKLNVITAQLPSRITGQHLCTPEVLMQEGRRVYENVDDRYRHDRGVQKDSLRYEPGLIIQDDAQRAEPMHLIRDERSLIKSGLLMDEGLTRSPHKSSQVNIQDIRVDRSDSTRVIVDDTNERRRCRRPGLEPPDLGFQTSRQFSPELQAGRVARTRSYERPWGHTGCEHSRLRSLSPHVNKPTDRPPERFFSERTGTDRLVFERGAEFRSYNTIQSQWSPFDPSPLGPKPSPMEAVARNAWKQYSREYERYLSNLNEWNCQQEILRNKLGAKASSPTAHMTSGKLIPQKPSLPDPPILGSQMNPELEDEAMRIRIAVSTNNLRRSRPVAPSSTRPTQSSKRSVSTESISLIECQDPERQLLVNRVEVNRAHKVRVPTAQPEPTIFNEVEDSRVRVTALCKEHMSLRGMSVPPSRLSPSMGRSAVDHGLMGTTPGTYTDGKYYSQAVGSPERQGPNPTSSRKIRRHIMYAPQLKTGVPRDFLVYFLVSMATLASIFAAIGVFSKPDSGEHLDENPLQNSPGPISRGNPSEPLVLRRNRRPPRINNLGVCKSLECQREGVALASMLDWALDPCADFQAFACRSTRATPLQEMERYVGVQLQQRPLAAPLVHLQRLRRECLEVKGRSWNQLRGLLDSLGLEGWPFSDSSNVSRDRIWEVAAGLQRRLGIASLLAVSLQPGSEVLVRKAAPAWPRDEEDLMASRYHTFAGSLRGESAIDTSSQAAQVVQLARELSDLPSQSPTERARFDDSPYKLFFASLFDVNDNRTRGQPAILFSRQLAYRLTQLLGQAEPHVVFNYQGFLATLSVEPLLPDMNASETRCWRLVEDALPELFLYAVFRSRHSVMAALSNMTESVKRNVMLYVNSASWMEAGVRRESVERLRELRVHAFAPSWFWAADRVRVQFDMLSQVGSGQGIAAVAAFKEHAQNRLLRGDAWPVAPRDSQCAYDSSLRTLYLPILTANLSGSLAEPLTLARLPRMGTQLAACLLHVVISGAGRWWGARTVRNLEPLRKCVAFQAPQGIDPDPLLERMAALAPVHSLYDEQQRARGIRDSEYRLPHAENVTSEQLFFIYYGISQCHVSPEQVNLPLQNSEPFRKAFGCRTGTFMAPANTCRFWAS
ncbi:hypothetical protein ISCGN_001552 [Ixodes scapularis]